MKKFIIEFLAGLPIVIGLYILIDYLWCTFISHNTYVFSISSLIMPITVYIVITIVSFILRKKKQ